MYFYVKPKGTFKKSKNWMNSYRLLDFVKVSLKLCGTWSLSLCLYLLFFFNSLPFFLFYCLSFFLLSSFIFTFFTLLLFLSFFVCAIPTSIYHLFKWSPCIFVFLLFFSFFVSHTKVEDEKKSWEKGCRTISESLKAITLSCSTFSFILDFGPTRETLKREGVPIY